MLRSLLKSVCPLQTNIHINVIHQQLTNASSLQHFLHIQKSHCFCRTWVCKEWIGQDRARGWNLGAGDFLPQPLQCPGLAGAAWGTGAGSGRRCIPSLHCELLQRGDKCQALRGARALNRLFCFGFFSR